MNLRFALIQFLIAPPSSSPYFDTNKSCPLVVVVPLSPETESSKLLNHNHRLSLFSCEQALNDMSKKKK